MEFFSFYFPEIAKNEIRAVAVSNHKELPSGKYVFEELYCVEQGCDCRNVMINVTERSLGHAATINHSLDRGGFRDVGLKDTFLDPLNKQSRYARALLTLFKQKVLDEAYTKMLERHLKMVKEEINLPPIAGKLLAELREISAGLEKS